MKKIYKRSSEILMEIAQTKSLNGDLTFRHILQMLGDRTFGIALLFFSLLSAFPYSIIPGVSMIFGIPIIIFAFQMVLGRKTLWLPKKIADYTIDHEKTSKIIYTAKPFLVSVEKFLKPRLTFMTSRIMEIINGITCLCLALLLMLPIPFSNFIFSTLLIIFSLGMIEKDGLFIFIGYIATFSYIVFSYIFIVMAVKSIINWIM